MADIRISSNLPAVAAQTPARSTDAVRAAQRAFFDAALSNAASPAVTRPAAPAATSAAPIAAAPTSRLAVSAPIDGQSPPRPLRPGSLLDIRI